MKLVFVPLKDVFKECKGKRQFSIKKDAYRRFSSVSNEMQIGVKKIAALYLNNDVYFQVALLTTIGLSSKNAILIVEFAEAAVAEGYSLSRAALRAAQTRLRPIIMTSLAFIAGVMPLAIATGAGANSRIAIGTGIIGGTLTATLLAIFFVPLFFVLVKRLFAGKPRRQE